MTWYQNLEPAEGAQMISLKMDKQMTARQNRQHSARQVNHAATKKMTVVRKHHNQRMTRQKTSEMLKKEKEHLSQLPYETHATSVKSSQPSTRTSRT